MAPEQFLGKPIDARTDQFAFCVALYEALYGERPFAGETVIALADAVTEERVRALPKNTDVPAWVSRCVIRGLRLNPANRYADFEELLATLRTDPVARLRRRVGVVCLAAAIVATLLAIQRRSEHRRRELEHKIDASAAEGRKNLAVAKAAEAHLLQLRGKSMAAFDAQKKSDGERLWSEARTTAHNLDALLDRADQSFQAAWTLAGGRADLRDELARVRYQRAWLAELEFRKSDVPRHLEKLSAVDPANTFRAQWATPSRLLVTTDPPGADVVLEEFKTGSNGVITTEPTRQLGPSPATAGSVSPGSYRLVIRKQGYTHVQHPFVMERGVDQTIAVKIPRADQVPDGFVYVPGGPFLVGSADEQLRAGFLDAEPLHQRATQDYLVGRDEVTIADWLEFVEALPPKKRAAFLPAGREPEGARLEVVGPSGQWTFKLTSEKHATQASWGQPVIYSKLRNRPVDWSRFPVSGVSYEDAGTFITWYSKRHGIEGLRLCTEDEWEKAARGADGRDYPHGDVLARGDANIDITWDKEPQSMGPDAVGSYPKTTSPYGLRDVCGNVNELVGGHEGAVVRGGSFWHNLVSARTPIAPSSPTACEHRRSAFVCARPFSMEPPMKTDRNAFRLVLVATAMALSICSNQATLHASHERQGLNYQGLNYQGLNYQGLNYQGLHYQGLHYQGLNYQGLHYQGLNYQGLHYQGLNYQGLHYQGLNYQGLNYQGLNYQGLNYQGLNYQGLNYQGARGVDRVGKLGPSAVFLGLELPPAPGATTPNRVVLPRHLLVGPGTATQRHGTDVSGADRQPRPRSADGWSGQLHARQLHFRTGPGRPLLRSRRDQSAHRKLLERRRR